MRRTMAIVAVGLAGLGLGACRQEPTAKPVDNGTDVTAQTGAQPATDEMPAGAATAPASEAAPSAAPPAPAPGSTATPEASASPTPQ